MFKLKVNERFVGSRKAYTERDVDNYYKDEFIQERISKLISDIEKKKCFGLQDVESVDESFDYDHSVVIETSDPRIMELAEDEGLDVSSTVKLVLDMSDMEELRVILDSEGEASEINNYFINFKNYKSLLDTVQEAIESLIKGKTASRKHNASAEDECRTILTSIYNCIAENYKKYGFDTMLSLKPIYFRNDAEFLFEDLEDELDNLPIKVKEWKNHYDGLFTDVVPDVFGGGDDLVWMLHNNRDKIGVLFTSFLESVTGYCNTMLSGMDVDSVMEDYEAEDILETLDYLKQFNPCKMIEGGFKALKDAHEIEEEWNNIIDEEEESEYESSRKASRRRF